jgi:hypothetical protein
MVNCRGYKPKLPFEEFVEKLKEWMCVTPVEDMEEYCKSKMEKRAY